MRPAYKFPRSQASLDLSDTNHAANAQAGPSGSVSHPSLLVTDSQGHASGLYDEQMMQQYSDAGRNMLGPGASASHHQNPAHLSASLFPSKSLSRISEYSESAYSSGSHSRDSQDRAQSPSLSYLYSPKQREPSASSYAFPTPPAHAHLAASSNSPTPILATNPVAPAPAPVAFRVMNPDDRHPDEGLSAPRKHHLPSRPLTTPFPSEGLAPTPVPLDNFAAPPGRERSDSPFNGTSSDADSRADSPVQQRQHVMVQVPSQAMVSQDPHRYSYHVPGASQSTTQTAWQSAEEDFDAKFDSRSALFNSNGVYDNASAFGADPCGGYAERNASANRFTLDDDEKVRRRKASDASAMTIGTQGWDPEREKKGSNKKVWWGLLVLVLIGVGVGLGVGLSKKNNSATHGNAQNAAAAAESSSAKDATATSLTIPTILHPSSTAIAFSSASAFTSSAASDSAAPSASSAASSTGESSASSPSPTAAPAVETFSTTFGYQQGESKTVVPLTYTIPTSFDTRANGQWQFTEQVVLPNLSGTGSFTSDLRFRVQPTTSAGGTASVKRRSAPTADAGHWKRQHRSRLIR